jgi:asparagine synthase (glutamine-hydrolysing)
MCGITGVVYRDRERPVSRSEVEAMCRTLVHRGPDDEGFFIENNVGLAMRRLTVIDLVTGRQPISNEDGRLWIVFNGEIYNFPALREELERRGHRFTTHTDTETIVHAYEEYGEDCVSRLNGMFAFAVWDRREQTLFLARDHLGIKPLYYFVDEQGLLFGSELKALLANRHVPRRIDLQALDAYLTFEYVPAPLTIFDGVRKLPPGHTLRWAGGRAEARQYWHLRPRRNEAGEAELCEELRELVRDAVRMQLVSDVPLGAFLSGGVDSSVVVSMMSELLDRPVKTFSIGFDDPSYNELAWARIVAERFATDHRERTIRPDVVGMVQDLLRFLDEPLADTSVFPTYLVSRLARQEVTVVLSGDGGDELFAGYDWYVADRVDRWYGRLPARLRRSTLPWLVGRVPPASRKKGLVNKVKRFVEGAALPDSLQHFRWNLFLTAARKSRLYGESLRAAVDHERTLDRFRGYLEQAQDSDRLWQQQFADIKTFLVDDILVKVDRMSMANSLEARVPLLDRRIVEFAAGLPPRLRLSGLRTKYILKRSMAERIPPAILRRRKEGFSVPIKNWLKHELRPLMEEVLSPARLRREGLFEPDYVAELQREHLQGRANHAHELWSLVMFEIWRELYAN